MYSRYRSIQFGPGPVVLTPIAVLKRDSTYQEIG
jgi:hypothetical protein